MEEKKFYEPVRAEIVEAEAVDVITTSPFEPEIHEGEWDREM